MAQQMTSLAILFADISGSTRLYDTLGDVVARELVGQCLQAMTRTVERHGGRVVKTIGDEVMCIFSGAEGAVRGAMGIQETIAEDLPQINPAAPADLSVRIGLHYGPAILEGGDIFGDAVNVAARMTSLAKGGQIITTQSTAESLPAELRSETRHLDRIMVKGKARHINIFEVIWQSEDVTRMATGVLDTETIRAKLSLRYHEREVVVSQKSTGPVVMGRGKKADLVVNDGLASREHARVEMRRGKFILTDQSTNGTYVLTPDGVSYLRREEAILTGSGRISLGRDLKDEPSEVVQYACESS